MLNYLQVSVKAMGRFLCLIFEDYNLEVIHEVTIEDFKALVNLDIKDKDSIKLDSNILSKFRCYSL